MEQMLIGWTKPPSDTEEQKCINAERMVSEAIKGDDLLSAKNIQVFGQGSYKYNTNARLNSDVDVCARLMDVFYFDLPPGEDRSAFGLNSPSSYTFSEYKDTVEKVLKSKFGDDVERGKKSIKISGNSYRVPTDVVPCFQYRRYTGRRNPDGSYHYHMGTRFRSDKGEWVVNFPEQHYENGVRKNNQTGRKFKKIVRILKRLNYKMEDEGVDVAKKIPSFLIECLVWNVPNNLLMKYSSYKDTVKYVLGFLYEHTNDPDLCDEWGEVSELLYLFKGHTKWTKKDATDFTVAAWNHLGFS